MGPHRCRQNTKEEKQEAFKTMKIDCKKYNMLPPPYKTKTIEPIKLIDRNERIQAIRKACYNVFNLKSEDVYIDLLTDSGSSAMSTRQWSAIMSSDESYAGSKSFFKLQKAVQEILGFNYVIPCHQGRAAEHLLFRTLLKKGDTVPINMAFDTTAAHIKNIEAEYVNCVIDCAYNFESNHPFKGNINIDKLEQTIKCSVRVPFIMITITNNSGGGQPVSMQNMKQVKEVADRYNLPVFFDAARCAENAYFIQQNETKNKTVRQIMREQFSYADGCTFSLKKDALVNMGGLIAVNSGKFYYKILPNLILYEGFTTYGGLSGRDIEAIVVGMHEMIDDDYMADRVKQIEYLGNQLKSAGITIMKPIGGHAVFIDAASFLSHIPREQFPADALAAELYIESGVRGVGLGTLAFGKNKRMELFRLAIPRRVYTNRHLDYVADAVQRVFKRRDEVKGLEIVSSPATLRHFLARLKIKE